MKIKNPFIPKEAPYKWQFVLFIDRTVDHHLPYGWRRFNFGIFKLVDKQPEGMPWEVRVQHGFYWKILFWLPIDK